MSRHPYYNHTASNPSPALYLELFLMAGQLKTTNLHKVVEPVQIKINQFKKNTIILDMNN